MKYTTLNRIRNCSPCLERWKKYLLFVGKTKADDAQVSFLSILNVNGLEDAVWSLKSIDDCPEIRRYAVFCAKQLISLMSDKNSVLAVEVAEQYVNGAVEERELLKAHKIAADAYKETQCVDLYAKVAMLVTGKDAVEAAIFVTRQTIQEDCFRQLFCGE